MPGKKVAEDQRRLQIIEAAFTVASRENLDHLTIRKVADEANLSTGLVFFHFKSKDALLIALLDWLLDGLFEMWEAPKNLPPRERLLLLLSRDLRDAYYDNQAATKLEVFFAFWTMGLHHPEIKEHIRQAIERAKQVFFPTVCELLQNEPERFPGVTAEGLVTVILGIAEGCALEALLTDGKVDIEQILTAQRALLSRSG
ncbi:TetR/AcrR family transcriptional regulator [Ktedonosporobacter rubrisoli]|uniref:TetR/AcrR family transcriptional regulator n=1 Tax=Ktedonosporobacter rubrisoli TaxID=2509675 RepID=A0A4P6JP47_KTERU|nr:TetR/AcrR family transcriptional regulator [Ktedonosporobacter rubrisoli]QBD76526.1 TetR/AcrR family transcriptional regulator [Ktedonosporobacter rubrisoli]